uniref:putative nuclease HARBI1 n=1 Tax=Pristiophorus japonicus TaxID=55135 RepID=UPI00398F3316
MSEEQCLRRLRFRKEVVTELCYLLRTYLAADTSIRTSLSVAMKVTVALNFYATGTFESPVGDKCNSSQFAIHCCICQVTDALYGKRLDYIKFSMSREDKDECNRGFASCHDAFILWETSVPQLFKPPHVGCGWLLGNKGYGVAPLRNPTIPAEQRYNTSYTTTQAIIEQTIGILKQRFPCLDRSGGALQYSPDRVSMITDVCRMLHNLAIMRAQPLMAGMDDPSQEEDDDAEEDEDPQ